MWSRDKMVTMRGLDKKLIAVRPANVLFLDESSLNDNPVCNVHFANGKWVTAGLCINEVISTLEAPVKEDEQKDREARMEGWRATSRAKREMDLETKAAMKELDVKGKRRSYHSEQLPDGTVKVEIIIAEDGEDLKDV